MGKLLRYAEVEQFNRLALSAVELDASLGPALIAAASDDASLRIKHAFVSVAEQLERGVGLSEALGNLPGMFPASYVGLAESAEKHGRLAEGLRGAERYLKRMSEIQRVILTSFVFPLATVFLACNGLLGVAAFLAFLSDSETVQLLLTTQWFLPAPVAHIFTLFMRHLVLFVPAILCALIVVLGLALDLKRNKSRGSWLDSLKLRLPLFGRVFKAVSLERFVVTFEAMRWTGASNPDSLRVASMAVGNAVLQRTVADVLQRAAEGLPMHEALRQTDFFDAWSCWMIGQTETHDATAYPLTAAESGSEAVSYALRSLVNWRPALATATLAFGCVCIVITLFTAFQSFHGG